ncbi:glycoside hydrolase family 25 protein [Amycolatopsis jiangsuensis]|uniref:GH25 family lysozyme M1 (1,4-beta-N-acetylmuramidase) n=1 Tax=Amycolatopsis jiangsuensis TaxID=1181879 RepID=A0A840J418_9PSEU|nr:glycoside hydrolase family 25 protein [Amycolatopsis jiangsuensis]MBB4689836.1 GH25 family lysozyme M1 (1,4-beta-N-acetylmuramidase) [Amycolatopsis jiangsuensis]
MALGIDIYRRFQTVTSWSAVKAAKVTFVYVKLTDGGGMPAGGRGDAEVAGAKSVGIPVGGYHFVQASPSPEAQADVLLGEVRRLSVTGCAPMLDLEDNPTGSSLPNIPDSQKRAFAVRFLNRVAAAGLRPGVYLNNALAKALRPDTWGVPGLVIWIARYGAKPDPAAGRYDIHQYSSSGSIPGITASGVDLDESYTSNHLTAHTEEDDMADLNEVFTKIWYNALWTQKDAAGKVTGTPNPSQVLAMLHNQLTALTAQVSGLSAAVAALSKDDALTPDAVRQIVTDAVAANVRITGTVEITGAEPAPAGR